MAYCVVLTSCKDMREAKKIARDLVEKRLAACVNMVPIKSTYRWKGKIEDAREVLLLVKTRGGLFQMVAAHIRRIHSYELPEIILLPIRRGHRAYLDWIAQSVAP